MISCYLIEVRSIYEVVVQDKLALVSGGSSVYSIENEGW